MHSKKNISEDKNIKPQSQKDSEKKQNKSEVRDNQTPGLVDLQQQVGNRAVQRLIAQRSGEGSFDVEDDTADQINRERGGGKPLDTTVQKQMGDSMGHDFSGVRAHTSPESDNLNKELGAQAFTTGQDIFFREGSYEPHSSGGKELIAHELTHVVQQGSGAVGEGGNKMKVNAPGDSFEQEADTVAKTVSSQDEESSVQRQEEEEVQAKLLQRQEEEEVQAKALQRQEEEEEELQPKALQRQEMEEEEMAQTKALQRQAEEEEEMAQTKALQRQEMEEEEMAQTKALQRQEMEEEEMAQTKALQRQEMEEEELQAQPEEEEEEEALQTQALQRQEELPEEEL
jgi:hypothetical protein